MTEDPRIIFVERHFYLLLSTCQQEHCQEFDTVHDPDTSAITIVTA